MAVEKKKIPGGVRILTPRVRELQWKVRELQDDIEEMKKDMVRIKATLLKRGILLERSENDH